MTAATQIEKTFREEYSRVLAALISQFDDFDLAEDALQDALERWQGDGILENPGAWLTTVARRMSAMYCR
jgi:RNA polymerase sigma-70 factor, ECF subfamily